MKRLTPVGTRTLGIILTGGALALGGCGDPAPTPTPVDVALDLPAHGFQLGTGVLAVASGEEVQACYFYKAPDLNGGQPYYVNRIEVAQNAGSHHMNIFRQGTVVPPDPMNPSVGLKGPNADGTGEVVSKGGKGACFMSSNWADWPLIVNSQESSILVDGKLQNYVLDLTKGVKPGDNVSYKVTPGEIIMLQSHWVNASTQKTPGRAKALVNFYQNTNTANVLEVGTLFATKQSISVCKSDPKPSFSGFCKMNSAVPLTIIAANGHFHSRGQKFLMNLWDGKSISAADGQEFYKSMSWDEPPMMTGLSMGVPSGGGVSWTCDFQWTPSPACADGCSCLVPPKPNAPQGECCYGFGGLVENSEHCNAFVYYYPKLENKSDITCM